MLASIKIFLNTSVRFYQFQLGKVVPRVRLWVSVDQTCTRRKADDTTVKTSFSDSTCDVKHNLTSDFWNNLTRSSPKSAEFSHLHELNRSWNFGIEIKHSSGWIRRPKSPFCLTLHGQIFFSPGIRQPLDSPPNFVVFCAVGWRRVISISSCLTTPAVTRWSHCCRLCDLRATQAACYENTSRSLQTWSVHLSLLRLICGIY